MLGAPGVENGVTDDEVDDDPEPATFTARIWTSYVVPFWRFVIEIGLEVVAAETHADQAESMTRYS